MMRWRRNLILFVTGWVCAWSSNAQSGVLPSELAVSFKDAIQVSNRTYVLKDIASLSTTNTELVRKLEHVVIGDAPRPGQSSQLSKYSVLARIEEKVPGVTSLIDWQGPSIARVVSVGRHVDGQLIVDAAHQKLKRWLRSSLADEVIATAHPVGRVKSLTFPAGQLSYKARLSNAIRLRPRISVWVDVEVAGEVFDTIPVWFAVTAHKKVLVSTGPQARGEKLSTGGFVYEDRDISGLASQALDKIPEGEYRLRSRLSPGEVLMAGNIEQVPEIEKGDLVTVLAEHGTVSLKVKAKALSDGRLNQEIVVENPQSKASYTATVIGKKFARVK